MMYINTQRLTPPLAQTKDNDGLIFQTPAADIYTASTEKRESTNVPALWERSKNVSLFLRLCSSSVSFFSLSRQPFSWLTLKAVWHTWFIAGDSGGNEGWREVTVLGAGQEAPA